MSEVYHHIPTTLDRIHGALTDVWCRRFVLGAAPELSVQALIERFRTRDFLPRLERIACGAFVDFDRRAEIGTGSQRQCKTLEAASRFASTH